MTLNDIDALAQAYRAERDKLASAVQVLETEVQALKRRELPTIKRALAGAAGAQDQLKAALEAAPELFEKPRTRVMHGIKVGFAKQKGCVSFDDEGAVIARIRKLLPADQSELLIRVRESVAKAAVYDLTTADLKRLGITVSDAGDALVIKPVDGEVDKLINALLKDTEEVGETEAAA